MAFVILGVVLIALNLLGIGIPGRWVWPGDWWRMCWPFGLALLWWMYADKSGLTKRREMRKMDERRLARRRKSMEALGIDARGRERSERGLAARQSKAERKAEVSRAKNRDTVSRSSRIDSRASSHFDSKN